MEICLAILEEPSWCLSIVDTRPFKLFCKSGLAQTSHGGLIFLLWTVTAGSVAGSVHEQFMSAQGPMGSRAPDTFEGADH
jgi:hypothetical protein